MKEDNSSIERIERKLFKQSPTKSPHINKHFQEDEDEYRF